VVRGRSLVAVCCSVLQCVAVCCSVLQCVAVCCSVLQCVAVCCSVRSLICYFALLCTFPPMFLLSPITACRMRAYGVATISRLLKIIGLFCRVSSVL